MMVAAQRGPGCCRLNLVASQRPRPVQCSPVSASRPWPECVSQTLLIFLPCLLLFLPNRLGRERQLVSEASVSPSLEIAQLSLAICHPLNDLSAEPGQEEWRLLRPHCSSGMTSSPRCPPGLTRAGQEDRNSGKEGSLCGFNLSGARNKNMDSQDLHICSLG